MSTEGRTQRVDIEQSERRAAGLLRLPDRGWCRAGVAVKAPSGARRGARAGPPPDSARKLYAEAKQKTELLFEHLR